MTPSNKAFTLVELMIVIAIIGILAAALFPSLSGYLARSRDATRRTYIQTMVLGVSQYNTDTGKLPDSVGAYCDPNNATCAASGAGPYNYLKNLLVPNYLKKVPIVPEGTFGYFKHDYRGFYTCPVGVQDTPPEPNKFSIYTSLEQPNQKDSNSITEVFDICLINGGYNYFKFKLSN